MDDNADKGLAGQFALDAPNAIPGAGAGSADGRSYTCSAPAPTPSPDDAGETDANPHGGITVDHDGVQPGDESAGQSGCRSAPRKAEIYRLDEEAFYGLPTATHSERKLF